MKNEKMSIIQIIIKGPVKIDSKDNDFSELKLNSWKLSLKKEEVLGPVNFKYCFFCSTKAN